MSQSPHDGAGGSAIDYVAVEESPRFVELKRKHRSVVFPLAVLFLVWYFVYVLLSSFAPDFMAQEVWGHITIGLLLGLGQFVTTFAITMGYVSFANRKLDPISSEIRADLERQETR
ncbi:DUF485 domain-containing protein [Microbacterium marinum]|uniref:Uncharacterized membrane protein (DUF485 family) n=1 Tax=Microbacterium marinum TaxID=421115 RepID=A0A7W7FKR7_9MICO|nr:DUF485 domain-containing protein [Microbacterium marinum]MBB4666639.1 uncharacterized membrane protein (DUF485 family) [Microbacterium marinum]HCJ49100.1 DUF485 domain-containing protein [Microbacterium sp.]